MLPAALQGLSEAPVGGQSLKENMYYVLTCVSMHTIKIKEMKEIVALIFLTWVAKEKNKDYCVIHSHMCAPLFRLTL